MKSQAEEWSEYDENTVYPDTQLSPKEQEDSLKKQQAREMLEAYMEDKRLRELVDDIFDLDE